MCLGLTALLSGCAHTPEWFDWHKAQTPAQTEPAVPAVPAHEQRPPRRAPRHTQHNPPPVAPEPEKVATLEPATLVGKRRSDVTKLLGTPSNIAKEEMSLIWSYEADGCALKIYFYPDLKTSAFHVLKFSLAGSDGKPLDSDAPCRSKLLAVRDHDTG
jgi:hypothetical protein